MLPTEPRVERIGLFGGSFNPPHLAHLALARVARDNLQLDELRWLPAGQPWQKPVADLAAAEHRLAMVAALIAGETGFVLDNRECLRDGPSYTLTSVLQIAAERPGAELFLILGQDQCQRLGTWHQVRQLLPLLSLAVAPRQGRPLQLAPDLAALPRQIQVLPLVRWDISSSAVRALRAAGEPVSPLVGEAVARYIDQHALYLGSHRVAPGH
jgi:nicotinate-nucleotide adenylyltransferase